MKKTNIKLIMKQAVYALVGAATIFAYFPSIASASPITNRKVVMSSSVGDATGVTYTLTTGALPTTGTAVKSMEIKLCTSLTDSCASTPSGFSSSSSTLASQPTGLGSASGWTVNTSTAGSLRILNAANSTTPSGSVSVAWNGVHNPTNTNATFYGIITTYSDSGWTTALDTGSVALSTSGQVTVTATVNETLTFTLATATIALGAITPSSAGTDGTHTMIVGTNASSGYTVSYGSANTLTSGGNTIAAMAGGSNYTAGTPGFGINLAANTTPISLGAAPSGGTGAASTGYNTANQYKFNTAGDQIASAAGPSSNTTYTFSYAATVGSSTPAGAYSTNINYVATANF